MTQRTLTRRMRDHFGAKRADGKPLPALPNTTVACQVCGKPMVQSEGQISRFHGCCRKYKNNRFAAQAHIRECHGI